MKRRREIGPKIKHNFRLLIWYVLGAIGLAAAGGTAAVVLDRVIGLPGEGEAKGILYMVPGIILALTILAVLGLLFFGIRGYLSGIRQWQPMQRGRMRIKR